MVVATGFFDGVHVGHRLVIRQLTDAARQRGDESLVVTFWPHPRNVLQQEAYSLRLLTTLDEKIAILKSLGVDHVEVLNFTKEFSALTMKEYFEQYVAGKFGGKAVVLGYDNRMGCDSSVPDDVAAAAVRTGLDVIRTSSVTFGNDVPVSSTKIRGELEAGHVDIASSMLGYEYSMLGVVVAGNRIGRTIGFPTANMQLYEPLKLVPGNGVYYVKIHALGKEYDGMCNIGTRPTVGNGNAKTIETNIFGFDEDIYGLDIKVTFIRKIREEVHFGSLDLLRRQLEKDRLLCKSFI